jgi:coenzyme Q-binding protein COQ10
LKVGYDALGIEENWESIVSAEEGEGTIEARSADKTTGTGNGVFEVLKTKWQLHDVEDVRRQGVGFGAQTAVRLDVEVKFRSAMYDKVFAGVEEKVAGMMVGAFEKRIRELAGP